MSRSLVITVITPHGRYVNTQPEAALAESGFTIDQAIAAVENLVKGASGSSLVNYVLNITYQTETGTDGRLVLSAGQVQRSDFLFNIVED